MHKLTVVCKHGKFFLALAPEVKQAKVVTVTGRGRDRVVWKVYQKQD